MLRKQVGSGKKRVMHRERIWTLHIVTAELFINQQSDINQCCEVQSPSYVCKAGAEKPEPRDHTLQESNPHPPQDASTLQGINAWTPSRENFPRLLCGFCYKYRNFLTAGFDPRSAAFSTFRAFCGYSEDFSEWAQQSYTVRTGKIKHLSLSTVLTILSQLTGQWPYHTFSTFTERLAHAVLWVSKALVRDALLHWSTCLT